MSDPCTSALLTDAYQLTMAAAYLDRGMNGPAVFEFFIRRLTDARNFFLCAGVQQLVAFLENLRLAEDELDWLARQGFRRDFVRFLADLRFTGDVYAIPEGTVFFPPEPVVRIVAPLVEAQLVESRLINLVQFPILIASKAARSVLAAPGKLLVDFGMRRSHGAEAALLAARASFLAGFHGTSNVLAARQFGLDTYGTMAHSFIQAHDDEAAAFRDFARSNPDNVVLLIDTYDTEQGAARAIEVARQLRAESIRVKAVRIDSGDLAEHARRVRRLLDEGGFPDIGIFASGNLDEWKVAALIAAGAPIDGFGIGSRLDVSADLPYLDCAYKLQEYAGLPRRKRSEGKATWPGRKQVFRTYRDGLIAADEIALEGEPRQGEPLMQLVMKDGRRTGPAPALPELRRRALAQLELLPPPLRALEKAPELPVGISQSVKDLAAEADRVAGAL